MNRREFLLSSTAALGAILIPFPWGCKKGCEPDSLAENPYFDFLEVIGSHYDIGKQIGSYFAKNIHATRTSFKDLDDMVLSIINADPQTFYDPFVAAVQQYYPEYVEELTGTADGAGLTFEEIMRWNMGMDVLGYYQELTGDIKINLPTGMGCSTISCSVDGNQLLAHNEDLFTAFLENMYIVRVRIPGKPEFLSLCYPGMLPGIPPGMNEAGICLASNYISGLHVEPSVPIIVLSRSIIDATSVNDAKNRAAFPHRARTMTHNICSITENKIISVEAAPLSNQSITVEGLYVHTNHFILPEMVNIPQNPDEMPSSVSRFNILTSKTKEFANKPEQVTGELLTGFLSSHENSPLCPCLHDPGNGSNTLAHVVFDLGQQTMKLYYANPCLDNHKLFTM